MWMWIQIDTPNSNVKLFEYIIFCIQLINASFKSRMNGNYNLNFTPISAGDSHLPLKIEYIRLDENLSSGCNEYDASEDFSVANLQGWTLEDINFNTSQTGEQFDFLHSD